MSSEKTQYIYLHFFFPNCWSLHEVRGGLLSAIHTITGFLSNALLGEAAGQHSGSTCLPTVAMLTHSHLFIR